MRQRRLRALASVIAISLSLVVSPVVVQAWQTETATLSLAETAPTMNDDLHFTASISSAVADSNYAKLYELVNGIRTYRPGVGLIAGGQTSVEITTPAYTFGVGSHDVVVEVGSGAEGYIYSPPITFEVLKGATTMTLTATQTSVEVGTPVALYATMSAEYLDLFGSISFYRAGSPDPLCEVQADTNETVSCSPPIEQTAGSVTYTATYSGTVRLLSSTDDVTVTVTPNVAHVSNVKLQYTTFYPYSDGYKDTVAATGSRAEPIAVTIKVYSSAGTLLKTATVAQGTGNYSWAWNGRNSSGTIYAEGSYKVVQTLKDVAGATAVFTSYVTLSKKKLYTYTKTYTKNGSSVTAKGTSNGGTATLNTTSGYAKLTAPFIDYSWAGVGWEFTVPSAAVYKSLYVKVYTRHSGAGGTTHFGAQSFTSCAYSTSTAWHENCFGAFKSIPVTSGTTLYWRSSSSLGAEFRSSGRKVRLMLGSSGGTTYIYKARVVVTYGVLAY